MTSDKTQYLSFLESSRRDWNYLYVDRFRAWSSISEGQCLTTCIVRTRPKTKRCYWIVRSSRSKKHGAMKEGPSSFINCVYHGVLTLVWIVKVNGLMEKFESIHERMFWEILLKSFLKEFLEELLKKSLQECLKQSPKQFLKEVLEESVVGFLKVFLKESLENCSKESMEWCPKNLWEDFENKKPERIPEWFF